MSGNRPGVSEGIRPAQYRHTVPVEPGSVPRNGLPVSKPYVYRGTGRDELTAHLDKPVGVTRQELRMTWFCWEDMCTACPGGRCLCACHDEPAGTTP